MFYTPCLLARGFGVKVKITSKQKQILTGLAVAVLPGAGLVLGFVLINKALTRRSKNGNKTFDSSSKQR